MATSVPSPPKILILDNDETTGSYYVIFSIFDFMRISSIGNYLNARKTFGVLIDFFEKYNVFRPGLRQFLEGISDLKNERNIDKICMYTNQLDIRNINEPGWISSNGRSWSVPDIIAEMFSIMTDTRRLIDEIFTRPVSGHIEKIDNYPVKDLNRVYSKLYPGVPVNLSETLFIDDLHQPKYIVDSSKSGTDSNSRFKITGYYKRQPDTLFIDIIEKILEVNDGLRLGQNDVVLLNMVDNHWKKVNGDIKNKNKGQKLPTVLKRVRKFFESTPSKQVTIPKYQTEKNVKSSKDKRRTIKRRPTYSKTAEGGRCK